MSFINSIISNVTNPQSIAQEAQDLASNETANSITALPSHLLQRAIQMCETKTELVVYLTIIRFSLGFNRDSCTLSRRFIASWTGLKFQNVGRGIKGLIAKGLIQKLPESSGKYGDRLKVITERNQNDYTSNASGVINLITDSHQVENTQGVIKVITERNQTDYGQSSRS